MSVKPVKSIWMMLLLWGLLLPTLACISTIPAIKTAGAPDPNNSESVRSFRIMMDVKQHQELFTQLQKFADKHSLKFGLSLFDGKNILFSSDMSGNGFVIIANNVAVAPDEIRFKFFNNTSTPNPQKTIDGLFDDLKRFLLEIPNVTIADSKYWSIKADTSQNEEQVFAAFFAHLQEFADQHSLKFTVSAYDRNRQTFLVEMVGEGFAITSEAILSGPKEMNIIFYIAFENATPTPTSQEKVDELFRDLNRFLSKYPNVTITESP